MSTRAGNGHGCTVMLYVEEGFDREQWRLLHSAGFQSLPLLPTIKLYPSGADSQVHGCVYILGPYGSGQ